VFYSIGRRCRPAVVTVLTTLEPVDRCRCVEFGPGG